jgi:uncharacterized protein with GYD domain
MRYYFHVQDGTNFPDEEGTELADDEAAKSEAIAASAEMMGDLGHKFWAGGAWDMQVVDETGREVLTLHFRGEIRTPGTPRV